ncbi:hypothetical protein CIPAW_15G170300 [Carya illinoinensis]|uniref:Uncharacterized protein n=1 Tax=Carya illinoinensis TaxID=32201 RepID=A0A8T1NCE3_CARIL|nr:hypothetical protein CIPAW_15G170300 [Carya illinoinensis]
MHDRFRDIGRKLFDKNHPKIQEHAADYSFMKTFEKYSRQIREQIELKQSW